MRYLEAKLEDDGLLPTIKPEAKVFTADGPEDCVIPPPACMGDLANLIKSAL